MAMRGRLTATSAYFRAARSTNTLDVRNRLTARELYAKNMTVKYLNTRSLTATAQATFVNPIHATAVSLRTVDALVVTSDLDNGMFSSNAAALFCDKLVATRGGGSLRVTGQLAVNTLSLSGTMTVRLNRGAVTLDDTFMSFASGNGAVRFGAIKGISVSQAYLKADYLVPLANIVTDIASRVVDVAFYNAPAAIYVAKLVLYQAVFQTDYALKYGRSTGGVVYSSGAADFAEWMPATTDKLLPGQLVGITNGVASLAVADADFCSAVSANAAVVGNTGVSAPSALVALMGQVDALVLGPVVGEYVVATGNGTGVCRPLSALQLDDMPRVLGQCLSIRGKLLGKLHACVVLMGMSDQSLDLHEDALIQALYT